jgi:carbon storage regulator
MLTLTRTLDLATILIGDEIKIHLNKIDGNQIKISIDAPKNIDILRGELRWRTSSDQDQSAN